MPCLTSDQSWQCCRYTKVLIPHQNALHTLIRAISTSNFSFVITWLIVNTLPLNLAVLSKSDLLPWKIYTGWFLQQKADYNTWYKNWPVDGGAFSRDFTMNLSLQCRVFSRAFKTEKLKAPLVLGSVGVGTQMTDALELWTHVLSLFVVVVFSFLGTGI